MAIYLLPIGAFLIGWLFFYVLIKLFFNKRENAKFGFVGILKANKANLASKAGIVVQEKFLDANLLKSKIEDPALLESIKPGLEKYINYFLEDKLVKKYPIITMIGGDEIVGKIKSNILDELDIVLPQLILKYANTLQEKIPVKEIVVREVMKISELKLQELVLQKTKNYLLYIPLLGGILGLLISLISILILKANF